MAITSFNGQYRFLSNFAPVWIRLDEIAYRSVEHAYQAAKTLSSHHRNQVRVEPTAAGAKRVGGGIPLRPDWDVVKLEIMRDLLEQKFMRGASLGYDIGLRKTDDQTLIEGNTWHDNYWGMCSCDRCGGVIGQNHLGKLLMEIRERLRAT